jgi:uncharacterized protein YkwD
MTAHLRRAAALLTLTAAVFGSALAIAAPASAATSTDASYEAKVVSLTNDARVKNGCAALRTDGKLTAAARAHSADMVQKNTFSHTGSDGSTFIVRIQRAGYAANATGENIAWGYRTPADVVNGWLNSPTHRANILNCASKAVGVGLARKSDGTPYWTQDFGSA